jgi:hypothetical protein
MRGVYSATAKCAGITAAKTLMYLTAPAGKVVEILSCKVGNENNATNYQLQVALTDITTLGTPTATSVTPVAMEPGDQASGCTVKANVTASEPTYGNVRKQEGVASLVGYRHEPVPEERIVVGAGASIGVRLITTPGASTDFDVELNWREIG